MDVDRLSFYPLILDILTDISEAHFVAIDLELSGVPSKDSYAAGPGKPSLQQRYLETKEAAERYQILQIGLTCVEQDIDNGKYILKPYNFHLSPIIQERGIDVERIFSFQSGAVEFLLKVGFDMAGPFVDGVPYLSRMESREARDKFERRQNKSALADIELKPTETASLAFVERVRGEIKAWLASRRVDALDIMPVKAAELNEGELPDDLSRFERRLVHQLVRAEFPELVSFSRRGFVQIVRFNREREDRLAEERKREFEERLNRQKGFRWLIEALHGSNVNGIDFREVAKNGRTGEPIYANLDRYKAQLNRAHAKIRGKARVLVGHNCFLDMVYIYRTFVGDLPDTVEEFQHSLHELWPVIVDTKYMSTHNCGDISPASSLEQIAQQMKLQETPTLETDADHSKYDNVEAFHEAGYDSFLTAQVAIKLSAKLEREGACIEASSLPSKIDLLREKVSNTSLDADGGQAEPSTPLKAQGEQDASQPHPDSNGEPNGFTPSVPGGSWRRYGDPSVEPSARNRKARRNKYKSAAVERTFEGGMPRFSSEFWRVYGNKLRVFGTEEGMCVLDKRSGSLDSEDGGVVI